MNPDRIGCARLVFGSVEQEIGSRERVLKAAISIVEAEGEAPLRVDRVAEMAGYTKPVIYHHFGDREGLIIAVQIERYRQGLQTGLEQVGAAIQACESIDDFVAVIRSWIASFGTPQGSERRRIRMEVLGSAVSRPRLRESVIASNREYMTIVGNLFEFARERGWLAVGHSGHDLAVWFTGVVLGRHLAETDPAFFDASVYDQVTDSVLVAMITGGSLRT